MSNFERRHLRYFIAVAEELHFGRAARRLHISQPPLSQQIAMLENDLGVRLFERSKRKVELTSAGIQFLKDARAILADMTKSACRARLAAEGQTGILRIGLNYSAPINPVVSLLFHAFARQYPHVNLELNELNSAKQLQGLYRNTLDLCFIWATRDDASPDITLLPVSEDELYLIAPQKNLLAHKQRIDVGDLKQQMIFLNLRQIRMNFYDALLHQCHAQKFEPEIRSDIPQLLFIMSMVAAGQGIAFVPKYFNQVQPKKTIMRRCHFIPKEARSMPFRLAFRSKDPSPLVQNFATIARKSRL